jgi:hypothetical protein
MSWRTCGVEQTPSKILDEWLVLEIPSDGPQAPWPRHLVGIRTEAGKLRITSPVELFDPVARRAVTRSGTVYELRGEPGHSARALLRWHVCKDLFGVTVERDVTDEVSALFDVSRWPAA